MSHCIFHDTDAAVQDRLLFEIVERAYNQGEKVVIFTLTDERAVAIDRMLWIHKQESFIPHEIFRSPKPGASILVAIVTEENNPVDAGILIADGHCSIEFALSFGTIHEFVNRSSPQVHEACRDRFRIYRSQQVPVEHLKA